MISSFTVAVDFDRCPKAARFPGNERADTVDGCLIVRGRLGFDETFEQ
jgi:hypothetical protein